MCQQCIFRSPEAKRISLTEIIVFAFQHSFMYHRMCTLTNSAENVKKGGILALKKTVNSFLDVGSR